MKRLITILLLGLVCSGCSIKKMAMNKLGDALSGGGTAYSSDNDPELIRDAVPFSLKLMESVLEETPRHRRLLEATAGGFTQYAFAFVQQDAEELAVTDVRQAQAVRRRARVLYLRGRDYALRGLEVAHAGFREHLRTNAVDAVRVLRKKDVPLTYWAAASWGAAIGIIKDDTDLMAEIPSVQALIDRALELDPDYDSGALHTFLITYETVRPVPLEEALPAARGHFKKAVAASKGLQAGPYVSLAENVCVAEQNRKEFEEVLQKALAIDVDARPEWRLSNLVMQRRARWLLDHADDYVAAEEGGESEK